ncbi:MAG TPA: DNA mismatch repair endonuclease MutL [Armatimonadota bacterium]|nr:DNA mismatch repair endonuclease MutL [Armatimonadota bacterium]
MPDCRIRILEEEVANKIAAGEVVERPASVVKELVENAVDAGAARIVVEVEDGGKALIRVTDNGCGMTAQEAVIALQRHATSKITRAEDLAAVRTLGFRGEALPSVASVARVTLVTRARGELEGIRLEAEGGEIRELEPAGAAEGTAITVRDLFYNTPARLKFLKTTRTELGQICDVLTRAALSHPEISFRLLADGDEILHAPGSPDAVNTVAALYGKELARDLVPVEYARPVISVRGYVSRPTVTRPTRSGQHLFVNGRWVRSRTLTHALDEAYRASMPGGRFPFAVIQVEIDPALVDVNVHPTKTEVRFLRDWEVHRAVHEAVREAIGAPAVAAAPSLARQQTLRPEELRSGPWLPPPLPPDPGDPFSDAPPAAPAAQPLPGLPPEPPQEQLAIPHLAPGARPLRPIAQLWSSYILAEGPDGVVIIDQHLAHERVLFDRLGGARPEGETVSQRLAIPLTLQLAHREALALDELAPRLAVLGFELEPFGRDAFVVRAVPATVAPGTELTVLRGLLDDASGAPPEHGTAEAPADDRLLASAACRTAVKKGARLSMEEIRQLMDDLGRVSNPHTCPHGCPIAVEISFQELLKRFKRI